MPIKTLYPQIIVHRVNTLEKLERIPTQYGVEVDLRASGNDIILNHEPFASGPTLQEYLANYNHAFTIFNVKEAGIEQAVIDLAKEYQVKDYFLLDVEFPYIYKAARAGVKDIAIRYSEDEPIEAALKYKGMVDWVWIDTNTKLPLDREVVQDLAGFRTCLVSPDRWGRPGDIPAYRKQMADLGFQLDAVMCAFENIPDWESNLPTS